jgi:hypothetical protein
MICSVHNDVVERRSIEVEGAFVRRAQVEVIRLENNAPLMDARKKSPSLQNSLSTIIQQTGQM